MESKWKNKLSEELTSEKLELEQKLSDAKAEKNKLAEKFELELFAERQNTKNLKTELAKEKDEAVNKFKEEMQNGFLKVFWEPFMGVTYI